MRCSRSESRDDKCERHEQLHPRIARRLRGVLLRGLRAGGAGAERSARESRGASTIARRKDQIMNVITREAIGLHCMGYRVLGHDCATTCQHFQAAWPASNPIRAGIRATDSQFSSVQFPVISRSRPALTPPPAPVRLRRSRSNTSTKYSLLGATLLSQRTG